MALSGTIYGSTNNEWIDAKLEWTATQSIANNTSTITATLYYIRTNTGYTTHGNLRGSITIDGDTKSGVKEVWITETHWEEALTTTETVSHNSDGTKSISISATGYINNTSLDSTSISGTITLDTIHRKAYIVSAQNFTDEGNPTITYENPAGSSLTSLQACISFDGDIDIPYRDISKTGTSYTFNLTTAERNTLRAGTAGKSRSVWFYVKSVVVGLTTYTKLEKTLTIVNANPVINPTIVDSNATTKALTGDANKLIKYYSNATITIGATGQKYATITSRKVSNGSKNLTADGTINAVENGSFTFTATDSRGFSTTKTVDKTLINYTKLTCDIENKSPTVDGSFTFTVSGNYFNGTFGATSNNLTVYYRYKPSGGSYSSWATMAKMVDGNRYTATADITGLDYRTTYIFQAYAVDKLLTVYSSEKSIKSLPVFDWSDTDFNFNVPVSFSAGFSSHNILLWQGAYFMTANQTAPLTTPVSQQANGIVLVFSNYDNANSKANDYDWHCYFVPKYLVDIKDGTGHCFNMMSQSFGDICSKYIYISDTELRGHDNNTKSATNNGITYSNAKYVLRYIFGV